MASTPRLHWAAVQRNHTTLAECGNPQDLVVKRNTTLLANQILKKKTAPGWETEKKNNLKAYKLHVHTRHSASNQHLVFAYACVCDASFHDQLAKGFLEKLALMSEPVRSTTEWENGQTLAAQNSFAPTLLQRMEQANSSGKTALVSQKVSEVRAIMSENIELLLDRGDNLEQLEEKTTAMSKMSLAFRKRARDAKRFQLWQQAKFGLTVGTAVTVGVAIVVVPPVLAVAL